MNNIEKIFSDDWFRKFVVRINSNTKYREAAKDWEDDLILFIKGDRDSENLRSGINKVVLLSLYHGECKDLEFIDRVPDRFRGYVIEANASTWEKILNGKADIITAILAGTVKVTGDMKKLIRYMKAATELVKSARDVR